MGVIDEIKQKLDIVEVIGEHTKLTKSGRNFRALCPFHSEKNPSFYVYPERQGWHCFGACATGGDVFTFIMKKQGIEFGEALQLLANRAGVTLPARPEVQARKGQREKLHQANAAAAGYFHNLLLNSPAAEKARGYLARRGILPQTITDFQLGFSLNSWEGLKQYLAEKGFEDRELLDAGLLVESEAGKIHDRFRNKLMFTIFDARGQVTGFGGRVLDDSLPKYINSPQTPVFDKSGTLYAINLARPAIRQQDLVVIVEGYMDVITAHQNGFSNVIASMGTSITEKQVNTLKRLTRNVTLALDADAAGEEAMLRCVSYENTLNTEIRVIVLPEGKDPDDVIREDTAMWHNLVEQSLPVVDYTFDMVASGLDLTTARDKALARDRLLPVVVEIRDLVRQSHYSQKLARLVNVPERAMEQELQRRKPGPAKRRTAAPEPVAMGKILSSPVEDYCLALLLQHPELKKGYRGLAPEHFENTENRQIFTTWQQACDLPSLKEQLDPAIWEHLDYLAAKTMPAAGIDKKYADCVLRLRKEYHRSLEAKRGEAFALEAEAGGSSAELSLLEEQGVDNSRELGIVFAQERQTGKETTG
ncbi:DNA primase [Chloroflexota bacterium]